MSPVFVYNGKGIVKRLHWFVFGVLGFVAPHASAQVFGPSPRHAERWLFGVGPQMAQPIGAFATQINRAWGVGGTVRYRFATVPAFGIRADLTWLNYGNERKTVPLSPTLNRVFVDMNTANDIALVTVGPELSMPRGPIRPYVFAVAGYSYFYTSTSVGDDDNTGSSFAESTNYDDGGLTTGWGGGIRLPFAVRSASVALDAGARMAHNGVRSYLRRGDVVDLPDGTVAVNPRTTTADFWQYHVALTVSPRFR